MSPFNDFGNTHIGKKLKLGKKIFLGFGFLILGVCISVIGNAENISILNTPILEFFHGAECPHCQVEKAWLPTLKALYPNIIIKEYEVWHNPENKKLMEKRLKELNATSTGVPTNIINKDVFVGFSEEKILELMEKNYGPPTGDASDIQAPPIDKKKLGFIIGGVVLITFVGGFMVFGGGEKSKNKF